MRHPHGCWEHRHIHHVSPEDIKRRVLPWLEKIFEEDLDSAYHSQEDENGQGEGLEMKTVRCSSLLGDERLTS